jgi:hypothetical protein
MSQLTTSKIDIIIKSDKFEDLLSKLEDLSKIGDSMKIKIDEEDILIYSMVGENMILAFKSYILKTDDYFSNKKDIDQSIDIIITSSKKFVKNLGMIKGNTPIKMEIDWRTNDEGTGSARFFQIKSGKFKMSQSCGEESEIRNISKEALDQKLNLKTKKWSFVIKKPDFDDIKKLSNINSEGKILNLNVDSDGRVLISESSVWELEVDQVEVSSKNIIFSKSYLGNISDQDKIEFHVFESFILNRNSNSNLMISFETQFDD